MQFIIFFQGLIFFSALSAEITSLGTVPDWSELDIFQKTVTREEFTDSLKKVYCPRLGWWSPWIVIGHDKVKIRKTAGLEDWYELHFSEKKNENNHSTSSSFPRSLEGMVIALDPGHIGGEWSEMEKRHFSLGDDHPVKEGDLSLAVAQKLVPQLEALGVTPVLVRKDCEPVTQNRPEDFREFAEQWAEDTLGQHLNDSQNKNVLVEERKQLLFYRVDEIRARAQLINQSIKPDMVICIHLNAAAWKDPNQKELVERNDHHILVNGCYMGGELAYDDQRFELFWRLLNRWSFAEQGLAESLALSFSQVSSLPPFFYKGPNALKIGEVPGVWARNLLANRKYHCPVVFLEPYVANSLAAYPRLQKWLRGNDGAEDCIIEEYAQAVLSGLKNYFSQ